jgi:hypothetical protein
MMPKKPRNRPPESKLQGLRKIDGERKKKERKQTATLIAKLKSLTRWHSARLKRSDAQPSESLKSEAIPPGTVVATLYETVHTIKILLEEAGDEPLELTADERLEVVHSGPMVGVVRQGMITSSMLGMILVKAGKMEVIESSSGLKNFWMLSTFAEEPQGLAGQSLWSIVHWEDHETLAGLQDRLKNQDRSVVGTVWNLLLIRMTNSSNGFGLAKAIRRRIEVLHLSRDGTALINVYLEDEDKRALDMGDEGRHFCKDIHFFKLRVDNSAAKRAQGKRDSGNTRGGLRKGGRSGSDMDATNVRSGLSIMDLEKSIANMIQYAAEFNIVIGRGCDGKLRHMVFSRLNLDASMHPKFIPIMNARVGDFKEGLEVTKPDGTKSRDLAWKGWFIPGDDSVSRRFPWEFRKASVGGREMARKAATHGDNFLVCFFDSPQCTTKANVAVGYFQASPEGPIVATRRMGDESEEGMPYLHDRHKMMCLSEWEGMQDDSQELLKQFCGWEGCVTFMDVKGLVLSELTAGPAKGPPDCGNRF